MIIVCVIMKNQQRFAVNREKMAENFVKVLTTEEDLKNIRYTWIGCSGIPVKV